MALTPTRDLYSFFLKEEGRFLSVTPWPRHEALPDGIRREECFLDEDGDGPSQEGELMSMRDKAFKEIKECRSFMGLQSSPMIHHFQHVHVSLRQSEYSNDN